MMLKSLKHGGWPALLACAASAACTKTPAPEDAFVLANVGSSAANPLLCSNSTGTGVFFHIGQTNSSAFPTTQASGENSATIQCRVSSNNGGYDIALSASLPGSSGGAFTLTGHVDASGGKGLHGIFSSTSDSFASSNCTVTYTYVGLPVKPDQTVSAGQIFGHVDCPDAVTQGTTIINLPDGGTAAETCDADADFLFQNCSE